MFPIVPAIMPKNKQDLFVKAQSVVAVADLIQIDIMDGVFVTGKTWPYPLDRIGPGQEALPEGLPDWQEVDYELDLMIKAPERTLTLWQTLAPAAVVIHYESVQDWDDLLAQIENAKEYITFGLSFDDDLDKTKVEEKLPYFSYLQCMGIDLIGAQAQPFSGKVLENVEYFKDKYPELWITVDGSVNFDTIARLNEAGVDRFVVGSAIFHHDNPAAQAEDLARLVY